MLFIRDQIKCRKSSGNLTQQKPLEESIYIEDEDNNSSIDMDINKTPKGQGSKENYSVENSMSTFEVETPNTSKSACKKLKRNDEVNAEIIKIEKRKLDLLEQKSKQKIQTDNEDMAFFVSLLPHIKKMDPGQKLLCRMEIQISVYNFAYKNGCSSSQYANSYVQSPAILESESTQFSENPQDNVQYISEDIPFFQEQCINDI
ncbi:uncharacterized protein LOC118742257 isoform X1 [Rhagoletis pomonella]|uniref:uncharacterized protein LOC118742257 isoform X1 n=1 Tax=Rhagoletis pomonella TaxID=28610 RepID=UPI001783A897|nr:uncharacterized protein LOC118742257 isoform X1 [Rhagoletis pomonella]